MLDNMNSTLVSFDFGFNMPSALQDQFTKYPLPHKFDLYQFHSSFLVNYWKVASALAILLTIITIVCVLLQVIKKQKNGQTLLKGLKLILKWNFFLMIFCTNFDGIVIGTSLQLRTLHLDSFTNILSFLFCIFVNLLSVLIIILAIYIIRDLRKNKQVRVFSEKSAKNFVYIRKENNQKWQEYQLFYKGSKDKTFAQCIFMIPYLLRLYLFNFMIANVYSYPLAQAIVITSLSVFMNFYIQKTKPFVSLLVYCQHSTDEIIMLIVNSCMLGLAICDAVQQEDLGVRNALGNVIIYCNVVFSATANIYTVSYLATGFKAAYDSYKKNKEKGILGYFVALLAPYEVGGMDMEADVELPAAKMETNSPLPILSPTSSVKLQEDGANSRLLVNDAKRFGFAMRLQHTNTSFHSNAESQEAIENLLLPEKGVSPAQSPTHLLQSSLVLPERVSPQRLSNFGLNARRSTRHDSQLEKRVEAMFSDLDISEDFEKKPEFSNQKRLSRPPRSSRFRNFDNSVND